MKTIIIAGMAMRPCIHRHTLAAGEPAHPGIVDDLPNSDGTNKAPELLRIALYQALATVVLAA
jgi:hypothetical protein